MPSQSPLAAEAPVYDLPSNDESDAPSTALATMENDPPEANSEVNRSRTKKRTRGVVLTDIWAAAREPKEGEEPRDKHGHRCFYCSISIERAISGLPGFFDRQKAKQEGRDLTEEKYLSNTINKPAFLEALVQLISKHSLPLNIVEWPEFYALIASVNYVAANVVKASRNKVPDHLKSRHGFKNRLPGYTSLLICGSSKKVEKALLALRELPGTHSDEAQAEHVLQVIDEYNLVDKIGFLTLK
ncbi:hypothetical protein DM02DRAFT_664276 [Periconia macrospinosa]|uniref:Uncharacterized protein n=1 Tax=Periconia macrospinosa TaxID=97972 RepID=A0A2V1D1P1_9PLEO|nr:hypothetical protein DM02DRAFT_664276 [Periconia macrospinosa]